MIGITLLATVALGGLLWDLKNEGDALSAGLVKSIGIMLVFVGSLGLFVAENLPRRSRRIRLWAQALSSCYLLPGLITYFNPWLIVEKTT